MDAPLTRWYCDVCGKPIEDASTGYVIWKTTDDLKSHSFKIIHQGKCDLDDHHASAALNDLLNEEGLTYLLSMLSLGPLKGRIGQESHCDASDMDEFVDLMRRVQTPYYEEARRLFNDHDVLEFYADANEVLPYLPSQLRKTIEDYGES